ncbi:rhomboid family intramembrane serine protease [Salisaeta longa]|uniref:rhomboid family intramembrane serine protease n=1 Tax=Salisaeta longa TaxID=503170 RepID=UPI0003B3E02D|nr:rhomboid family intramembrane serine protease [Salisaeta longa]
MLIPIGDDDQHLSGPAFVTLALMLLNLGVFFLVQQAGGRPSFTYGWSVIPYEIYAGIDLIAQQVASLGSTTIAIPQAPGPEPIYLTVVTSLFMHGGYGHLFGNLLYLWIFGDNVEHRLGAWGFLGFYLLSGAAGVLVQIWLNPTSVVPMLGASGAISGVLGAYLVFFPKNKVHALLLYTVVSIPASLAIGVWVLLQFVNGIGAVAYTQSVGGVAYGAHIGGFVLGVLLALGLRALIDAPDPPAQPRTSRPRSL